MTVTASDADAAEEDFDRGTFTIVRTGDTSSSLTVTCALSGSAENGTDYQPLGTSVTIAAGASSATVTVTPIDDTRTEEDETVTLALGADAAYDIGSPNNATVTIHDNDGPPSPEKPTVTVSATDADAYEQGQATGAFTISRTGSAESALTVNYSVSGTAVNGTDYERLPGSVTLAVGASTASITVTPIDDSEVEGEETVVLTLAAAAEYEVGSPGTATVTIVDNDEPSPKKSTVTVAATDTDASEEKLDMGTFTISRTNSTEEDLTVHFSLGGSADNGIDYQSLPTSVTIPAGAATATVTVRPVDDDEVETDETVELTLTAEDGYTVGSPDRATISISDNDEPPPPEKPTVTVAAADLLAAESGTDPGRFTVSRTGSTANPLTVRYALGGTAQNGSDYQSLSGSVTIAAGASSANVIILPIDDRRIEIAELVILTLSADDAYKVGLLNTATVTILDNDLL